MNEVVETQDEGGVNSPPLILFSSGCQLLDLCLGGGFPLGRMINIIGDKATAKTLLAMEALANFSCQFPGAPIWYNEPEASFQPEYATTLGIPMDGVTFIDNCDTVEDLFEHLDGVLSDKEYKGPGLYIVDSMDALSSDSELKSDMRDGTFGTNKAMKIGQLFRRTVRKLNKTNTCLMIISQTRARIGFGFGPTVTRSGGKALDFYASQILMMSHLKQIEKTSQGHERAVGVRIKAKVTKNKIGLPFRECEFNVMFNYGIDDLAASCEWLANGSEKKASTTKLVKSIQAMPEDEYNENVAKIRESVAQKWHEVETSFQPTRKKYNG